MGVPGFLIDLLRQGPRAPAAALAGARLQGRRPDGDLGKQLFDGIRSTPRELEALRTASWPEEQLPLAGVATLFLRGERTDRAVYPTPEQISSWVADAEVQTLPGQDHLATTFGPHDVATRILDFAGRH